MKGQPNYLEALSRLLHETEVSMGVCHVEVRHADECARWSDGSCDCEPTLEVGARIERKYGRAT